MKFRVDKVKKVLKMNSREYYDYLDKMNQNLMNEKKKTIKANRDSILKTNQNNFEIRELPDNPGSNYSSVKKESVIREDLNSDQVINKDDLKFADYKSFQEKLILMANIFVSFKEYLGFDLGKNEIIEMLRGTKPTMDEAYHNFIMAYKKGFFFGENGPEFSEENDKMEGKKFNWDRMKKDVRKLKSNAEKYYETVQKILTKKVEFGKGKEILEGVDLNLFLDFVLEKYIEKGSTGELFDSNIKEEKSPKKDDFEFNMDGPEGDVFEKEGTQPENTATTFALDQETDAFAGFEKQKTQVGYF
jgi:hypothetical protein